MSDATFMQRALALAAPGVGRTGANPSVGCVIVRDGVVVGEGATADGGRPHAEELALAQAGERARGAHVYVTLEPCAKRSTGAPSCSDILIQHGVGRVVIAAGDPHPYAAGVGVERLCAASVVVETGVLETEVRALNADFFARWERTPAIDLVAAQDSDRAFAAALYLETMRPHTEPLMVWDEAKQREAFAAQWDIQSARIIRSAGSPVGWLQCAESQTEVWIQHFYVAPTWQRRGVGTEVLRRLCEGARKRIVLTVLQGNPARSFYARAGFTVVGEDALRINMAREP